MNSAIQIRSTDTVATAVAKLATGDTVQITGAKTGTQINVSQDIPRGHKIALRDIASGEHVLKYGEVIGMATEDITMGQWVHVHNCRGIKARRYE